MAFSPQVINSQMQVQQRCLLLQEQNFARVNLAGCSHFPSDRSLNICICCCCRPNFVLRRSSWLVCNLASSGSSSLDNISSKMNSYKWMARPLPLLFWRVVLGNIANNSVMQPGKTWQSKCGALGVQPVPGLDKPPCAACWRPPLLIRGMRSNVSRSAAMCHLKKAPNVQATQDPLVSVSCLTDLLLLLEYLHMVLLGQWEWNRIGSAELVFQNGSAL